MKKTIKSAQPTKSAKAAAIEAIARDILRIETLEERKSDELDFYDRAVWTIEAALEAAYEAGRASAQTQNNTLEGK